MRLTPDSRAPAKADPSARAGFECDPGGAQLGRGCAYLGLGWRHVGGFTKLLWLLLLFLLFLLWLFLCSLWWLLLLLLLLSASSAPSSSSSASSASASSSSLCCCCSCCSCYGCSIPVEIFVTKSEASGPLQNGFWLPFCAKFWPWVLPSCKWTPPGTGILHWKCEFVTLQSRPFCRSLEG